MPLITKYLNGKYTVYLYRFNKHHFKLNLPIIDSGLYLKQQLFSFIILIYQHQYQAIHTPG